MSGYTPGPWKLSHGGLPGDAGFSIASNNALAENVKITAECWPCTIVSEEHRQELFANARLIAAAPEMLEALVGLREDINWMLNNRQFLSPCAFEYLDAAIAKAEGRTP